MLAWSPEPEAHDKVLDFVLKSVALKLGVRTRKHVFSKVNFTSPGRFHWQYYGLIHTFSCSLSSYDALGKPLQGLPKTLINNSFVHSLSEASCTRLIYRGVNSIEITKCLRSSVRKQTERRA